MPGVITLLTDFGTRDAYVAAMKGVILSMNRDVTIVDISHEVAAQDVVEGAWVLASAFRYFPPGTVHLAVVDPGVGGERRAIAAEAGEWRFAGPDNGVLTWALECAGDVRAVELTNAKYVRPDVSATFHGRDVFAPVAAHLAAGVPLDDLGPRVDDLARLPVAQPRVKGDALVGEVLHVDRFGNLITNIDRATLERFAPGAAVRVEIEGHDVGPLRRAYADASVGELLALIESTGRLEVAVREGSAAAALGCARGTAVIIRREQ